MEVVSNQCPHFKAIIDLDNKASVFCPWCRSKLYLKSETQVVSDPLLSHNDSRANKEFLEKFELAEKMAKDFLAGKKVPDKDGKEDREAVIEYFADAEIAGGDVEVDYWIGLASFFAKAYIYDLERDLLVLLSKTAFINLIASFTDDAKGKISDEEQRKLQSQLDSMLAVLKTEFNKHQETNEQSETAFQVRRFPTDEYEEKLSFAKEQEALFLTGNADTKRQTIAKEVVLIFYQEACDEGGSSQLDYWLSVVHFRAKSNSYLLENSTVSLQSKQKIYDEMNEVMDEVLELHYDERQTLQQEIDHLLADLRTRLNNYEEENPAYFDSFKDITGLKKLFRKSK